VKSPSANFHWQEISFCCTFVISYLWRKAFCKLWELGPGGWRWI